MTSTTKESLKFDLAVKLFGRLKMKITSKAVIKKMREKGYVCQLADRQSFSESYKDPFVGFYNPKTRVSGEAFGDGKEYWDEAMIYQAALSAIDNERSD